MEAELVEINRHIERCKRHADDERALYDVSHLVKHMKAAENWLWMLSQAVAMRRQLGAS